jgi:saccharopine dehydrogenase-like NADP-dependent oxidoreductase
MKLVRHPVDTFLSEDESTAKLPPKSAGFMVIEIKGAKSGEDITYKLIRPSATAEETLRLYRTFGATRIGVALTAIVGAKMCVEGNAGKGVIAPECLDPVRFLKMMSDMGAPVKFQEICSKEVAIS